MAKPIIEVDPRSIWEREGQTYCEIGQHYPAHWQTVQAKALAMGFRREKRGGFTQGPCVSCMEPMPREEIGSDYMCDFCRKRETGGYTDLQLERMAYRYRRRVQGDRRRPVTRYVDPVTGVRQQPTRPQYTHDVFSP